MSMVIARIVVALSVTLNEKIETILQYFIGISFNNNAKRMARATSHNGQTEHQLFGSRLVPFSCVFTQSGCAPIFWGVSPIRRRLDSKRQWPYHCGKCEGRGHSY